MYAPPRCERRPDTTPQVGTELTASLEDQDGSVVNLTWQWQKDDGQGSYTDIPGATMMSYTPVMADEDSRLQATAMYDDGEGSGKEAMGMTAKAVGACDILSRYDTDGTPGISRIEASIAVLDYLIRDKITRDEAIQVVTAYREDPLIVGHRRFSSPACHHQPCRPPSERPRQLSAGRQGKLLRRPGRYSPV